MRIEISAKLYHLRLYGHHADNFEHGVFMYVDGVKGFLTGLNAELFYDNIDLVFDEAQAKCGVTELHGSVTAPHMRLIRMKMKDRYQIDDLGENLVAERGMQFIRVMRK